MWHRDGFRHQYGQMSDAPSRGRLRRRLIPLAVLGLAGLLFMLLGGRAYLNFASLAAHREILCALVARGGAIRIVPPPEVSAAGIGVMVRHAGAMEGWAGAGGDGFGLL